MKLISIEDQIIKATISALLAASFRLSVDDGETEAYVTIDPDAIFAAMKTTDEDFLHVWMPEGKDCLKGWVRFVYGNDDIEVINDYTTNLEPIMGTVMEIITEYEDRR